uniref:glycosyltransferase n=1 Tax=Eubacterium cellulosolvens TaxID=29322 RepID=UPI00047FC5B2|nr:glycosyltransferase [[Eubacterium] cellulosolvens]
MSKLRVMHVLNTNKYSGAENVVITMINAYRDTVDAVYVSMDGPIREYLEENNIDFFPINKMSVTEVKKAIKCVNPQIIHAHDYTTGIISVATLTRIPIINHIHNNSPWIKRYGVKSLVYGICCNGFAKILSVSDSIMDEYVFGKKFKSKTDVVSNPIDVKKIRQLAEGSNVKEYDIAFLGRLSPPKNPHEFIRIILGIKHLLPSVKAVMIGGGELTEEVKKHIKEENLIDTIELVGFQKNPYWFLNQTRILCMPSSWEGYGLAAVEGLALGKPVICSGAGGLKKIVNDTCGRICEQTEDYISEIMSLLYDAQQYDRLSQGALRRAEEIDNLDSYCKQILSVYQSVHEKKCVEGVL